ncbi:MAG: dihydrodipicolinate reductase C-terminal domain-containing protein [Candidatus Hadarchaeales archaeon]
MLPASALGTAGGGAAGAELGRERIDRSEAVGPERRRVDRRRTAEDDVGDHTADAAGCRHPGAAASAGNGEARHAVERADREQAVRGVDREAGDVVGDPRGVFAGPGERIELTHRAHGREAFAEGVLKAIRFVVERGRPGQILGMEEVLGLKDA